MSDKERLKEVEALLAEYLYGERDHNRWAVRLLEAERKRLSDPAIDNTVVVLEVVEEITDEWRVYARVDGLWYKHPHPSLSKENAEMIARKFDERGTAAIELWQPVLTIRQFPRHPKIHEVHKAA